MRKKQVHGIQQQEKTGGLSVQKPFKAREGGCPADKAL